RNTSFALKPSAGTNSSKPVRKPTPAQKELCVWKAKTISCRTAMRRTSAIAAKKSVLCSRLPVHGSCFTAHNGLIASICRLHNWERRTRNRELVSSSGTHAPHTSQPDSGPDGRCSQCFRRRHHRPEALGAFLPEILRRSRRRFYAGDCFGGGL